MPVQLEVFRISLTIYSLIILLILTIMFYRKERMHNAEDNVYGIVLIAQTISIILGLIFEFLLYKNGNTYNQTLVTTANKLYLFSMYMVVAIIDFYIFILHTRDTTSYGIFKYKRFIFESCIILTIMLILPERIIIHNGWYYPMGPAYNFGYFTIVLALIFIATFMVIDRKRIKNIKYMPIAILFITMILSGILMYKYPEVQYFIGPITVAILLMMYFTIENPDVKQITALKLAKNKAEQASLAKTDFLSSMSHELRTPLNVIVGLSEDTLEYADRCPEEVNENSKDIVTASQNLLEIVGNILDINKIEANKIEIVNQPYNFKEEITNICNITKNRIGEKNIEFHLSMDENIPNELIGDKGKIKEIINNILTNAIKYTDKGHINLDITCENREDSKMTYLTIICKDTGKGIKEEDLPKLFTKFERLDVEQNSTIEGTGLGLLITKEMLTLMGGKIEVKSTYKVGTTVIIKVPQMINKETKIIEQKENTENQKEEIVIDNLEPVDYTNKKILIVDDNKLNIKVARRALKDFNIQIDECYDGQECLNKITNGNEYDLILMDIMMPNMNGEKALNKLKENPNFHIPTIALTADAVAGAKEKYEEAGFDDFIMKPFHKEEIKEKLDKMFRLTAKSSKAKEEVL